MVFSLIYQLPVSQCLLENPRPDNTDLISRHIETVKAVKCPCFTGDTALPLHWWLLCLNKLVVIVFVPLLSPVFQLVHSGFLKYTSGVHFITVNENTKHHLTAATTKIYESNEGSSHSIVHCFHLEYKGECVNIYKNQKRED